MIKILTWPFEIIYRILVLILAKRLASEQMYRSNPQPYAATEAQTCGSIARQDLIDALDGQIAVLEQEKKLYQNKARQSYKPEQKIRYEKKVASIEVQIAQKTEKVLKLRTREDF